MYVYVCFAASVVTCLDLFAGAYPELCTGGADREAIYTWWLTLNYVVNPCQRHNCNITLFAAAFMYILTYSLTACSTVLLEKLTGLELVKKFHAFYRTRRFITAFTSARHLSLSWSSSIQAITSHPTSWRSILILSSPKWSLSFRCPHQNPVYASLVSHTCYLPRPSHSPQFYHPNCSYIQTRVVLILVIFNPSDDIMFWRSMFYRIVWVPGVIVLYLWLCLCIFCNV